MKLTWKMIAVAALCATIAAPGSFAQDYHDSRRPDQRDDHRPDQRDNHHDDHRDDHRDDHHDDRGGGYVRHSDWRRGHRLAPNDWGRAQRIDYRAYHLSAPPRGYEWRSVDGNYVMAAVATGLISSVIIASSVR